MQQMKEDRVGVPQEQWSHDKRLVKQKKHWKTPFKTRKKKVFFETIYQVQGLLSIENVLAPYIIFNYMCKIIVKFNKN